jgi:hypothetical protein
MAINYANLFEDLGAVAKVFLHLRESIQGNTGIVTPVPNMATLQSNIETILSGNSNFENLDSMNSEFEGMKAAMISLCDIMVNQTASVLLRESILQELVLAAGTTDIATVLVELIHRMNEDSENIKESTVTINSVSANGGNTGNGTVLVDGTLDGVSNPATDIEPHREYAGVTSELVVLDETMTLRCDGDSHTDGIDAGSETFSIVTTATNGTTRYSWQGEYSRESVNISSAYASNELSNGGFESFSGDIPSSWTLDAGTETTHVAENADAANQYLGSKSLALIGDSSEAAITLSQAVTGMEPLKRYCIGGFVKGVAGVSSGTLEIKFSGTGYSAGSDKISLNAAALAAQTSYGLESFYVTVPENVPSDWKLEISWSGTPSTHTIYLDDLTITECNYLAGVNVVVFPGTTAWVRDDELTCRLQNDNAGVFQTLFRQMFGVQLPSDSSPTRADTLGGLT